MREAMILFTSRLCLYIEKSELLFSSWNTRMGSSKPVLCHLVGIDDADMQRRRRSTAQILSSMIS